MRKRSAIDKMWLKTVKQEHGRKFMRNVKKEMKRIKKHKAITAGDKIFLPSSSISGCDNSSTAQWWVGSMELKRKEKE